MKLVVDENIELGKEAFSAIGELTMLPGRKITNEILKNMDALIIRSVTRVDRSLLNGTKVKFVGTATIGTDHVDIKFLQERKIKFASAAGCNSNAVKEYVFAAMFHLFVTRGIRLNKKSIGIVGCGNIGSKVASAAKAIGLETLINDPPLEKISDEKKNYHSLNDILECDIITLHVPLNMSGKYKTHHLFDSRQILKIKPGAVLINTSRGAVVNNEALAEQFLGKKNFFTIFDVWENEPTVNKELVKMTDIATPHIAGYTLEGKVNGTVMVYNELCSFFGINADWKPSLPAVKNKLIRIKGVERAEKINSVFEKAYKIKDDDNRMKRMVGVNQKECADYFDLLRKEYLPRRELSNFCIESKSADTELIEALRALEVKILP